MTGEISQILWPYIVFVVLLLIIGLYCVIATHNLIRTLIGIEIVFKAVTLLLVVSGNIIEHQGLAQAMVITLVIVEVVVIVVAAGIVLGIFRYNNSLDTRRIRNLKG